MAEQYEYAKLTVDTVILKGLEADLANDNAVYKAYVDAHITTAINALVNGAVPALDTLKELGDALNNDANLGSVLTSRIAAVNTAITTEASTRSTNDATLTSNFASEIAYRNQEFSWLSGKIAVEANRVADVAQAAQQDTWHNGQYTTAEAVLRTSMLIRTSEIGRIESNFNAADSLINDRINDQSMQLENESSARSNVDNLHADRLNAIDVSIGTMQTEDSKLRNSKFVKTGGNVSGDITLVDSYLNFGLNWRVKASADGSKIVFQHMKADRVWRTAIPFICSV